MGSKSNRSRRYAEEFKRDAVALVRSPGRTRSTGARGHHRDEIRRLKTAAVAHLDYPHARQALQLVRWRRILGTGRLSIERIYLITRLPPGTGRAREAAARPRSTALNMIGW